MNLDPPYALWSIWHQSSTLQHWFVYTLGVLCLYAGFCVVSTISRLSSIKHLGISDPIARRTVIALRNRCATLRYAIVAEFYLFGIVLFMAFQFVGQFIMGNDIQAKILAQFVLDSAFATNGVRRLARPPFGSIIWLNHLSPLGSADTPTGPSRNG
jgi:hypothetical protein